MQAEFNIESVNLHVRSHDSHKLTPIAVLSVSLYIDSFLDKEAFDLIEDARRNGKRVKLIIQE